MAYPLLATKLFIPPPRPNRVRRTRLLQRLNEGLRPGCQLVLVSAPAGFGKTSLVCEWIQASGWAAAWLALDEADNDPNRLWNYIIAALQTLEPALGQEMAAALQSPQPPPLEMLVTLLINDLSKFEQPLLLALDDYHLLDSAPIHDGINFFLSHLPPNVHLVVLTRADPPLQLARRRGRGELFELRAADLRFTYEEIGQYLRQTMNLELPGADIGALEERTEGWIAGLQMAALSLQGRADPHGFISAFTGDDRYIADYLVEEVLQRQPEEIRDFLLHTSGLQRLNASLCDALTGRHDSQAVLNLLEMANLFIMPLDNRREWFRYHHLFAHLLQQHLVQTEGAAALAALFRRACEWHMHNDFPAEAVEYALAGGDWEYAARTMETVNPKMFARSELTTLVRWADSLPDAVLAQHPALCVGFSWAAAATGHSHKDQHLTELVERGLPLTVEQFLALEDAARRELPPAVLGTLVELSVLRARVVMESGDHAGLLERYSPLLPYLTAERDAQPFIFNPPSGLRPPLVFMLASAHEMQGRLAAAAARYEEAARTGQAANNVHIVVIAWGHLGRLQMLQGQLDAAGATFRRAVSAIDEMGGQNTAMLGMSLVGLGSLAYEFNQLEQAGRMLSEGITLGETWNNWETLVPGYIGLARLCRVQSDPDGAARALDRLSQIGRAWLRPPAAPPLVVETMRAELRLQQGDLAYAREWAKRAGYGAESAIDPQSFDLILLLGHLLLRENPAAAESFIERYEEIASALGLVSLEVKLGVLSALVKAGAGAAAEAGRRLAKVLEQAAPLGFVRSILDEGEPVVRLLQDCLQAGFQPEYARRLLEQAGVTAASVETDRPDQSRLVEPLSERELEILRMLATGVSNAEIAAKHYITVNTVKKHITNIYGKLGVATRLQAVEQARQLGLI